MFWSPAENYNLLSCHKGRTQTIRKNRVMRRKHGPSMKKLRERENFHYMKLQILYYVLSIVKAIRLKWT